MPKKLRLFAVLWIAALSISYSGSYGDAVVSADPNIQVTVVSTPGLTSPTGFQFVDDDTFFAIEKNSGNVRYYNNGSSSVALTLPVDSSSERGLLGIALDPNFSTNNSVYLYYSQAAAGGGWAENRVSRFTFNGTSLASETPLLSFPFDPSQANGPNHNGGPLRFGPDGMLYGVIGDLNRFGQEQNNTSAATSANAGGIFRINTDGSIPSDNPFVGGPSGFEQWFAYGVRNSFGLAFDPVTGNFWDTENGPDVFDEINLVTAGFNSGWKSLMGPSSLNPGGLNNLVQVPGSSYSDPEFSVQNPIGITSLEFLAGSILGSAYDDAVLFGDVNTGNIYLLRLNDARTGFVLDGSLTDLVANSQSELNNLLFGTGFGIVTDIQVGPDGAIYIASLTNNAIYRVVPEVDSLLMSSMAASVIGLFCVWKRSRLAMR
ncbi:PQQ-dependent sugar dehydrogenase [bacterium]|nr:PQQ-dependent sugar dehydrogenase [bacterium]